MEKNINTNIDFFILFFAIDDSLLHEAFLLSCANVSDFAPF
jgi:hypothetical protein